MQKRVQFALVQEKSFWLEFLAENFALRGEESRRLLHLGALYLNQKRWPQDRVWLQPQDVVRVHLQPRRFPLHLLSESSGWIEDGADWVLLWKPAGLPSHETLDNVIENCKAWLECRLGQKLWSLGRLDIGTRGWLPFAKNAAFAGRFHGDLENHRVHKFYETLSATPRQKGPSSWRHWMEKSDRAPRRIRAERTADTDLLCELEVQEQQPRGLWTWSRVELKTGRTHQIRAQFAFEGAPLLGDAMYGSPFENPLPWESFALSCESLRFEDRGRTWSFQRPSGIPALPDFWCELTNGK